MLIEMKLKNRYLIFAVHHDSPPIQMRMVLGEMVPEDFQIRLAANEISFWAYLDLKDYQGNSLQIGCADMNPSMAGSILQSDIIPAGEELYHEQHRPQFHFTAKRGWIGVLRDFTYKEGKWRLYYEHNPFGNDGLNIYTGCAVSQDLIHWNELESNRVFKADAALDKMNREDPQYIELSLNGNCDEKKWLRIFASGVHSIGLYRGGVFIPDHTHESLWYGLYSSLIVCRENPDGRCIQIGLGFDNENTAESFKNQMLVPTELKLATTREGIRLLASPVRELQNLRVWKRNWTGIELINKQAFKQSLNFRIAPGEWPDIRILPADGMPHDIQSDLLEMVIDLEVAEAKIIELKLCDIIIELKIEEQTIHCLDITAPLACDGENIRLQIFFDRSSLEIFVDEGQVVLFAPITAPNNVPNLEAVCHKGRARIRSIEVFGLRGIWPTAAEARLIAESAKDNTVIYQSTNYTIYGGRVEDVIYGEPAAYVPDRNTIISPARVVEEFAWRRTPWGDMTRIVDRHNSWHPNYEIMKFPDIFTGYNTFDVACRLALDIFYRCASGEFARPGERGLWSAGQFQGPGEGFGVWVRDTTHVAIRMGNLLDSDGARRSLLFTTMGGFNNGVDGIGMPIVGIWDYYLATGDLTLVKDTWLNLKSRIAELEERFDRNRGLIRAEQSTSNDAFPEPECGGYSLATEIYFMEAFRAMARMGAYMGENQIQVDKWLAMEELLRKSIRAQYWKESAGFFTSGPIGSESYDKDYWESSGQEMAIWPRYGVADRKQRASILKRLPEAAMNEFGVNVFPYRKETNHFCNAAWVVWTAGMAAAAGRQGNTDLLLKLIAQQVRNCVINKTFYEVIDYNTGRAWRWPGQLWHAAGFLSYFYLGVLGMEYDEKGLNLTPAIPEILFRLRIENFRYRKSSLDFVVQGWGTRCIMRLDGKVVDYIPAHIDGKHIVELSMEQ